MLAPLLPGLCDCSVSCAQVVRTPRLRLAVGLALAHPITHRATFAFDRRADDAGTRSGPAPPCRPAGTSTLSRRFEIFRPVNGAKLDLRETPSGCSSSPRSQASRGVRRSGTVEEIGANSLGRSVRSTAARVVGPDLLHGPGAPDTPRTCSRARRPPMASSLRSSLAPLTGLNIWSTSRGSTCPPAYTAAPARARSTSSRHRSTANVARGQRVGNTRPTASRKRERPQPVETAA